MAPNKYQPHLLILSEDDAYRDLASGFVNHFAIDDGKVRVEKPAGGWGELLDLFSEEYISDLKKYQHRHALLLLDLDGEAKRYEADILPKIPANIRDRVFVLSCWDEAENIKSEMGRGGFEPLGEALAQSCYDGTKTDPNSPWQCSQLGHNKDELLRLGAAVRPFLFP